MSRCADRDLVADVEPEGRGHLVVAGTARVQLPACRADPLRQHAFHGHVHVLVGVLEQILSGQEIAQDPVQPGDDGIHLVGLEHAGAAQRARVGLGSAHVVRKQDPVEAQ
jgi:hypothetical protein